MKRKLLYFSGLLFLVVLAAACGTQRKNPISKFHHSTNTLFNYYYNAERLWSETVKEVNGTFRVPPEGFIPVMYVGDADAARTFGSQFDDVIRKCDIAGEKHKSKKWKDDLRYLVGRAHFYKQNYFLAIQNFRYVTDSFPESKHNVDAYLWMVKAYHKNGNEILAQQVLEEKLKGKKFNKRQKGELAIIRADVALEQENYDEVIKTLNRDFKYIKGKLNRARAHYLLGQIYASRGQIAKAEPHFKAVAKMNTDYELIFNAKLSIASLYVGEKGDALERERVTRMLRKMLRDFKNLDYKDQIYYQLAMVEQSAGHLDPAVDYLKKSIAFNTSNQRQKALSYYKIGQIYFYDKKDFKMAEAYFDSAASSITKEAPEYKEVSTISKTLKEYVKHLNTIHYQDSMIALAKLDSAALSRHIAMIMSEEQKKEQEKQQQMMEEIDRMNDPNLFNSAGAGNNPRGSSGGFYFGDPAAVENGRVEFRKVWGQRKNEDHWNRKFKSVSFGQEEDVAAASVDSVLIKKYGDKAKYYKDIPKTPEEIDERHKMIMDALFGLGTVYNNKLNMPDSAVAVFTRLTRRYPDSDYYLKSLYAIYKIYEKTDELEADNVKSRICSKDPASLYCKLCKNQDVQADIQALDADFQGAYNALYAQYQSKEYSTCVDFSNFISMKFLGHEDMPKVFYLRGLAFGYMGNLDSLKNIFTYVKNNYPEHEVTPIVIKTLERMAGVGASDEGSGKPVSSGDTKPSDDRFKDFKTARGPGEQVFVIITTSKENTSSGDFQIKVNDFNTKFYASDKLTASIFFYQKRLHMAYVSKFTTEQAALAYIKVLEKEAPIAELLKKEDETIAFITPANFRVAYGQQKLVEYLEFYKTVILPSFQ